MWKKGEAVDDQADQSKQLRERAAEHFLASAKLNPSDGVAFRFLGHYYSTVSVDAQRSAKCYQRAVALNPHDSEAGVSYFCSHLLNLCQACKLLY